MKLLFSFSFLSFLFIFQTNLSAQDCTLIMPWTAINSYQAGEQVKYNGVIYQAKWYTENQIPSPSDPWQYIANCSGDTTTLKVACGGGIVYSSSTAYLTGNKVFYSGSVYVAKYDNQGQVPGVMSGAWNRIAFCDENNQPVPPTSSPGTYWNLSGNTGLLSTNFIGSTDYRALSFRTNNSEVIKISGRGNVGIGKNANGLVAFNDGYHRLTVNGPTNLVGNENALQIASPNLTATGARHYMYFSNLTFPNSQEQYSNIGTYEYHDSNTSLQKGKHMVLQAANTSNLGVGYFTSAPPAKLSVNGTSYLSGKVGIGDNYVPTGYMLSVNGKIICTEVAVKYRNTWPDYVFAKDYKLLPLDSLQQFISVNNHLPEVPSAKEVKENGIAVAEMNATLLKKIEELTLYILEQDRRLKRIETELKEKSN